MKTHLLREFAEICPQAKCHLIEAAFKIESQQKEIKSLTYSNEIIANEKRLLSDKVAKLEFKISEMDKKMTISEVRAK